MWVCAWCILEVSHWPITTRQPAVFPRHWPCLRGPFRPSPGFLTHRDADLGQCGAGPGSSSSHWLSASCTNLPDSLSPYSVTTSFFLFFSKVGSYFFQLRPLAETLKESGRCPVVSRSVLPLLLLCYCVKTHLLGKYHSSSPVNHIFPPLQWQGLRWLWPGSLLFLFFKKLHSTKTTSSNCLFQSLEQCLNWWSLPSCLMIK